MFLSPEQISLSLKKIEAIHPFYGTTFIASKLARLPVGSTINIQIAEYENHIMRSYYDPVETSEYYFQPFVSGAKEKRWVLKVKYATSTLQSTRTRGDFSHPFLHTTKTSSWGWHSKYVDFLTKNLRKNRKPYQNKKVPVFDLAVWLYRDVAWEDDTNAGDIVEQFLNEFSITQEEQESLFDVSIPKDITSNFLQDSQITPVELRNIIGSPEDAQPDEGGTLAYLELREVGPASNLIFEPAERLNLITGDNGLGKTFLLECAWWALTGGWTNPNLPAYPRKDELAAAPEITFQISGEAGSDEKTKIVYDWSSPELDKWPVPAKRPTIPGLVIYARVDGSFAVCDPVGKSRTSVSGNMAIPRSLVFTREEVWEGLYEIVGVQKRYQINGLIQDWVSWQNDPDQTTFNTFKKVLERLSPPAKSDLGPLKVGLPVRLPNDSRVFPTIEHAYGRIPIVHASAGVRRIVTIAYLLVWAWKEHQINSKKAHKEPQNRMVVLIDELEAHLHPHWQRRILPALLEVKEDLASESDLQVQSIIATHSPLVMASAEPQFHEEYDKLFHLDIVEEYQPTMIDLVGNEVVLFSEEKQENEVIIKELPFTRRGLVDLWLTSDVFELNQARSLEAEHAIEEAKALQQQTQPKLEEVKKVHSELQHYLADSDEFWPRWLSFAERNGVKI